MENLTRRTRIEKFTVSSDAPITRKVRGNEVMVVPGVIAATSPANTIWVERQYEREWKRVRGGTLTIEQYGSSFAASPGMRFSLAGRNTTANMNNGQSLTADMNSLPSERITMIDENVTFHCRRTDAAACTVEIFLEITEYAAVQ